MIYISITPGFYVDKGLDEAQMRARKKPTAVLTTRKTAFEYGRSHVLEFVIPPSTANVQANESQS